MSTTTTNYGLIKPDTTDPILIGQLNDNSDAIDAALKENADAIENKPDAADIPTPSTAAPAMDGTAAAGTSTNYARADHVHPSDTSKQDALTTAQLAAANSGIDSTKVEQIETNKNNISTDEAALVELVDGGAKNLLDLSGITPTVPAGITCVKDGEEWVVNGTLSTLASIRFLGIPNSIGDVKIILSGCPEGGSITTYSLDVLGIAESKDYGEGSNVFSIVGNTFTLRYVFTAGTYSDIRIKPMLCTKAAWDISQTYQPYRPSYQELYERIIALEQANQ